MAESWQAKAKRYARGDFTNAELKILVGGLLVDQVIDVATFGRLSKLKGKVLQRVVLPLLTRTVGRAGVSVGGTALGMGRLAMLNPYVLGGTAIYVGYHERERIKQLLEQGYEFVEERLPTPSLPSPGIPTPSIPGVEEIIVGGRQRGMAATFPIPALPSLSRLQRKRPSSFNKAVSAGMKAIKKSTSYGGKGRISPAKKAFSVVVKLAAAKKKKKKAPKSGLRRRIWNAMKGLR